jgi:hypothetical protein
MGGGGKTVHEFKLMCEGLIVVGYIFLLLNKGY